MASMGSMGRVSMVIIIPEFSQVARTLDEIMPGSQRLRSRVSQLYLGSKLPTNEAMRKLKNVMKDWFRSDSRALYFLE